MNDDDITPACSDVDDVAALCISDIDYDPADYRWVAVRRRPRLDGWTDEKQRRFVEALSDTGLVNHAAETVGMSRESAYRLRRSPHGATFARAWDAAREHAGSALEDIAFERAIEGVEQNVFNEYGDVICTKRVYNDRLLTFLLSHLKPERYAARTARAGSVPAPNPTTTSETVDACLREMESQLPAPPETLMSAEEFLHELTIADAADGVLPHFLSEQGPTQSQIRAKAAAMAAEEALRLTFTDKYRDSYDEIENVTQARKFIRDHDMKTLTPDERREESIRRFR